MSRQQREKVVGEAKFHRQNSNGANGGGAVGIPHPHPSTTTHDIGDHAADPCAASPTNNNHFRQAFPPILFEFFKFPPYKPLEYYFLFLVAVIRPCSTSIPTVSTITRATPVLSRQVLCYRRATQGVEQQVSCLRCLLPISPFRPPNPATCTTSTVAFKRSRSRKRFQTSWTQVRFLRKNNRFLLGRVSCVGVITVNMTATVKGFTRSSYAI